MEETFKDVSVEKVARILLQSIKKMPSDATQEKIDALEKLEKFFMKDPVLIGEYPDLYKEVSNVVASNRDR